MSIKLLPGLALFFAAMSSSRGAAAAVDLLSPVEAEEVLVACKVLLDKTSDAISANDKARAVIYNQAYQSICDGLGLPQEYAEYFESVRGNNDAGTHCFSLTQHLAAPGGGFIHRELEEYLRFRNLGYDAGDMQEFIGSRALEEVLQQDSDSPLPQQRQQIQQIQDRQNIQNLQ